MPSQVFIHTNHKQIVGALVGQYALKPNSKHPDKFDVTIIDTKDHDFLKAKVGQLHLRDGQKRAWHFDDLQSFTPLRFKSPELMDYASQAVVTDPDIFAAGRLGIAVAGQGETVIV